jgi:hydrogenase maturation factor
VLLNDAQTSGGLAIFVPAERREKLISALQKEGILAAHIGDVLDDRIEEKKHIIVER